MTQWSHHDFFASYHYNNFADEGLAEDRCAQGGSPAKMTSCPLCNAPAAAGGSRPAEPLGCVFSQLVNNKNSCIMQFNKTYC